MSRNWLYLLMLLPALSGVSGSQAKVKVQGSPVRFPIACVPPQTTTLNVTLRPQKTDMWCWAASGQMVMEYLGKTVQQCTQANNRFGRTDCCNTPTPAACILGGWPEFGKYGFTFQTTSNAALSWSALQAQLAPRSPGSNVCLFRPFAFSWHWVGDAGHMMVATGYTTDATGKQWVFVNNPWEPNVGSTQTILYDVYVELAGDHTHWNDYYDVK